MRDQQTQQDIGEPQDDTGNYEAQPGSSAPASTSERQTGTQPQQDVRESQDDTGNYEAQAGSSAPAATRERQTEMQPSEMQQPEGQQSQTDTVDRARSNQDGSGLIHDQRWQYFAGRWDSIQAGFVDDPRRTVEQADRLVAEVIDHLSKIFRDERAKLESQWSSGGKADTEDLRIAMQRYRDFFRTLVGR